MRNWLRRLWAKQRLRRICKALEIKPYPEAEAYILDKDRTIFKGGRCNGKTLTLILDELVYKRVPPTIASCDFCCRFCEDPDFYKNAQMERWYVCELSRAVRACEVAGIDVGRGWRKKDVSA